MTMYWTLLIIVRFLLMKKYMPSLVVEDIGLENTLGIFHFSVKCVVLCVYQPMVCDSIIALKRIYEL